MEKALSSKPIVSVLCLVVGIIINNFTYGLDSWPLRLVEIVLYVVAILGVLARPSSWPRTIFMAICALGILHSFQGVASPSRATSVTGSSGNAAVAGSNVGVYGDYAAETEYYDPSLDGYEYESSRGVAVDTKECWHCDGTGDCPECGGEGRVYFDKYTIDLGGGGGKYQEPHRCALCAGDGDCVYCKGRGVIVY